MRKNSRAYFYFLCLIYYDVDEFIDQKEFQGALYEQVENAINFGKQYIARSGKIEDIQRKDEYEKPLVAIREVLINAVL